MPVVITPAMLSAMVFMVSGVPNVPVTCLPTVQAWHGAATASVGNAAIDGFADFQGRRIFLAPWVCANLRADTFPAFLGDALAVVGHEATHIKRMDADEQAANRGGCNWASRLAQRFFHIPFWTAASRALSKEACLDL